MRDEGKDKERLTPIGTYYVDNLELANGPVGRMKMHKTELLALVVKRAELDRRIAEQLAQLVPYRTADGRRGWAHPRYLVELYRLGLL